MPLPEGYGFEMQMTAHGDTGYFKIHNDNATPRTASRFLTYVYYFGREPRPFSGGELRLYDNSQVDPSSWVPIASYAEIAPQNNMLLFFPSRCFHEVMPTLTRVNEFANGRFTINGWIRRPGSAIDLVGAGQTQRIGITQMRPGSCAPLTARLPHGRRAAHRAPWRSGGDV